MFICLFICLFILICSHSILAQTSDNYTETFKQQRQNQGEIHFSKAYDFFKGGQYKACIDKINEFLFLFPGHPATLRSLKLLSLSFKKNDQLEDSIETDLIIYRENPTTEEGLISYLEAGKKLLVVGKLEEGKKILENVKNQLYSSKVAKDAEIELKQNTILEENGFQIKEEISKE
jgi:TolA-binding protein